MLSTEYLATEIPIVATEIPIVFGESCSSVGLSSDFYALYLSEIGLTKLS